MLAGKSKVFIGLGGEFRPGTPDSPRTRRPGVMRPDRAHKRTSSTVPPDHRPRFHLILRSRGAQTSTSTARPKARRSVTVEDLFSMIHASYGHWSCFSQQMRSNRRSSPVSPGQPWATIRWTGTADANYEAREPIATPSPVFRRLQPPRRHPGGFTSATPPANDAGTPPAVRLTSSPTRCLDLLPAQVRAVDLDLILQTLRSHDQYNTTIYGLDDRYRGVKGQREDVTPAGGYPPPGRYQPGDKDRPDDSSLNDGIERRVPRFALLAFDIPAGQAHAPPGETNPWCAGERRRRQPYTPTSKFIAVRKPQRRARLKPTKKRASCEAGGGVLRKKSMKGLDGPLVGVEYG